MQEKVFKGLKKRFITEPILVAPDLNKRMRLEVNTSDYVIEGVLSVEDTEGIWRPVVYLSKSLTETEHNYEIHNKEMLAVIRSLEA